MSSDAFITEEHAAGTAGSVRILLRFVASLAFFRHLMIAAAVCAFLSSVMVQAFSWLSGEFTQCMYQRACSANVPYLEHPVSLSITMLALAAVAAFLIRMVGWIFAEVGGQFGAIALFRKLTSALSSARTTFFDENPSGRIINRVVRDFDELRLFGPIRLGDTMNGLVELVVTALVIGIAHPLAGLAVLPTLAMFIYIQRQVAPMLQRCLTLRSVQLGSVLHRETDAIEGIRTFYLYDRHTTLLRSLRTVMERFLTFHLLRAKIEAWGRFWSSLAAALCSVIALSAVAIAMHTDAISPVIAAVIVTAIFRLGGVFGWLTWSLGYLFESAAHARRIFEYVDLPSESSEEGNVPPRDASANAPSQGTLIFDRYSMRYRQNTPIVLSGISCAIPYGTHVGIVGRTGAGKSSLVQALFRMVYVEGGDIRIDNQSLLAMPVERARMLFTVVPQDPYLFAGTVRTNLDPFEERSDEELRSALDAVQFPFPLTESLVEGGRNISLGQRQLLALARVIVSRAPFVIMDEPTSSVDNVTDAIVQRVLTTTLRGRTVITIAHRLETLHLVDRVIELSEGRLVRSGTPAEILPTLSPNDVGL